MRAVSRIKFSDPHIPYSYVCKSFKRFMTCIKLPIHTVFRAIIDSRIERKKKYICTLTKNVVPFTTFTNAYPHFTIKNYFQFLLCYLFMLINTSLFYFLFTMDSNKNISHEKRFRLHDRFPKNNTHADRGTKRSQTRPCSLYAHGFY